MHVSAISFLHLLLLVWQLSFTVQARSVLPPLLSRISFPVSPDHADLPTFPNMKSLRKRSGALIIHGLPGTWEGIFRSIRSIQPPLPLGAFSYFFLQVANTVRSDQVSVRPYRKFTSGALALEFIAQSPNHQSITKEFVEAAAMWLFDAAQHGWTDFFEAKVVDQWDQDVVYIHMGNVWDSWNKPSIDRVFAAWGTPGIS